MLNKTILGTEVFSDRNKFKTKKIVKDLINHFIDCGIKKIDTAVSYGHFDHEIEKIIGDIGLSNKIEIHTKFKIDKGIKQIEKDFFQSLRSIKRDFIDVAYFHSVNNNEFINKKILDFFIKQKEKGYIKFLGLSFKHEYVHKQNYFQLDHKNFNFFDLVQTVLNIYSQESLKYVIPKCKKMKKNVVARIILAKGILTDEYRSSKDLKRKNKTDDISKKILNYKIENQISTNDALKFSYSNSDYCVVAFSKKEQIKLINL